MKDESELDDFMVEIDILSECKHSHVVGMYEAYYHENKLWVSSHDRVKWVLRLHFLFFLGRGRCSLKSLYKTLLSQYWHLSSCFDASNQKKASSMDDNGREKVI